MDAKTLDIRDNAPGETHDVPEKVYDISEERIQQWEAELESGEFFRTPGIVSTLYPQNWPKDKPMEPWFRKLLDEHPEWIYREPEQEQG